MSLSVVPLNVLFSVYSLKLAFVIKRGKKNIFYLILFNFWLSSVHNTHHTTLARFCGIFFLDHSPSSLFLPAKRMEGNQKKEESHRSIEREHGIVALERLPNLSFLIDIKTSFYDL